VIVDDLNGGITSEILAEFGDKHVHAPSKEVIVVAPHFFKDLLALKDPVAMLAKQA